MPIGTTLLLITAALIYFGAAQRLLDRMRLTDSQALIFIALMIAGSFITVPPLMRGPTSISLNLGGAVVPLALAIYLVTTADSAKERIRAIVASFVTAGIVFGGKPAHRFRPSSPHAAY